MSFLVQFLVIAPLRQAQGPHVIVQEPHAIAQGPHIIVQRSHCHCERSEAIYVFSIGYNVDCHALRARNDGVILKTNAVFACILPGLASDLTRDFAYNDCFACIPSRANHSPYTRIERKTPFRVYQQKILPHPIHADCDCISISRVIKNILRKGIHAILLVSTNPRVFSRGRILRVTREINTNVVFACIPSVTNH